MQRVHRDISSRGVPSDTSLARTDRSPDSFSNVHRMFGGIDFSKDTVSSPGLDCWIRLKSGLRCHLGREDLSIILLKGFI